MFQNRRRSVPAGTGAPPSPPSSQTSNTWPSAMATPIPVPTITRLSTPSMPDHAKNEGMKLLKQAEALASMNFELSLRAVSSLANRLERDVQMLVLRTAEDQDFRRQNEDRMTQMMHEIHTIKAHMAPIQGIQSATQADVERLQQEMRESTLEWNRNLENARAKIDDISGRLRQAPRPVVVKNNDPVPHTPPTPRRETRSMRRAREQLTSSMQKQQSDYFLPVELLEQALTRNKGSPSSSNLESRINEAINSTKRWNREHKVTKMRDNQFISGYLKKQRQRDPGLEKILQQTIQKRASKAGKIKSSKAKNPQSVEELCRNLSWQDVIATATDVLVANKTQTLRALGQA
ncbi:hypothetical protein FSARC_8954 [Fusarium sarcochroum]|uniref:Uncharacterized protein n=1 Tax=Fusarium sarcochroum TaxID=1208366 RepID=A0A8H4TSA4_9HYPO|nr:hypothetical protein FSARC_8954 [Fusarium sarcochroum]